MSTRLPAGVVTSFTRVPPAYRTVARVLRPPMQLLTARDWQGAEHLPAEAGCVVCVNHISHVDPFAVAHFLFDHGRPPFFLAKASLFELPLLGRGLASCGQVPVHRGDGRALDAFRDAVAGVREQKCIVIMPESTITKDPDFWPMTGKTGAARIALETGCPVLPLAQWGAHEIRRAGLRPHGLGSRPLLRMRLGPPVDLSDLAGRQRDSAVLREATTRIMTAITRGVEDLRGGPAPRGRWDPRTGGRIDPGTVTGGARRGGVQPPGVDLEFEDGEAPEDTAEPARPESEDTVRGSGDA